MIEQSLRYCGPPLARVKAEPASPPLLHVSTEQASPTRNHGVQIGRHVKNEVTSPVWWHRLAGIATVPCLARQRREGGGAAVNREGARALPPLPR